MVNIETTLELYSSADAFDKLARVHGLYKNSMHLEIEGKVGVLRMEHDVDVETWLEQVANYRKHFQSKLNGNGAD